MRGIAKCFTFTRVGNIYGVFSYWLPVVDSEYHVPSQIGWDKVRGVARRW